MSLLDLYENSAAKNVVDARNQSEGALGVNYFDGDARTQGNNIVDSVQAQFTTRTPGNKVVELASDDTGTKGTWLAPAFNRYENFLGRVNLKSYKGKVVHIYDRSQNRFVDMNAGSSGVIRSYGL